MDQIAAMRAFVAAGEALSFTAAASRLRTTPQAVAKAVAHLETQLGARLLNRTTRRMSLTEMGQGYLHRAAVLIADFDALQDDILARSSDPAGLLRIAAPVTFGWRRLSGAIAGFTRRHPQVQVDLALSDRMVDLVQEGFDLAIRVGEAAQGTLVARLLGEAELVVCASPGYLAEHATPAAPKDLADHEAIFDRNTPQYDRWQLDDGTRQTEARPQSRVCVDSADSVRSLVLAGAGIGLIPSFAVEEELEAGSLRRLLPAWRSRSLPIRAIYPAARGLAPKVRLMIDHLASTLEPIIAPGHAVADAKAKPRQQN